MTRRWERLADRLWQIRVARWDRKLARRQDEERRADVTRAFMRGQDMDPKF